MTTTTTTTATTTTTPLTTSAPTRHPDAVHADESATYVAARERSDVLDALIDEHASSDPTRTETVDTAMKVEGRRCRLEDGRTFTMTTSRR